MRRRLLRHADHETPIEIGQALGEGPRPRALLHEALRRDRSHGAMHPAIDPLAPAVELILKVDVVGEAPLGQEVRAHEAVRVLEHTLGLAIAGIEDDPADAELPVEAGQLPGRPAATSMEYPLAVEHQLFRQRPQPRKAAHHAPEDVRRLLG